MGILIMLAVWGLMVFACYQLAVRKNRNPVGWAIAGFLLGIFAVIVLALLSPVKNPLPEYRHSSNY